MGKTKLGFESHNWIHLAFPLFLSHPIIPNINADSIKIHFEPSRTFARHFIIAQASLELLFVVVVVLVVVVVGFLW